jgi:hypothetical protein
VIKDSVETVLKKCRNAKMIAARAAPSGLFCDIMTCTLPNDRGALQ